jgi:hypothetical protein
MPKLPSRMVPRVVDLTDIHTPEKLYSAEEVLHWFPGARLAFFKHDYDADYTANPDRPPNKLQRLSVVLRRELEEDEYVIWLWSWPRTTNLFINVLKYAVGDELTLHGDNGQRLSRIEKVPYNSSAMPGGESKPGDIVEGPKKPLEMTSDVNRMLKRGRDLFSQSS